MGTFNGERYIEPQLESILIQLGPADEVIVSDDQSSDATLDRIQSFRDPRIRIFKNLGSGVTANFGNALANAAGKWLFLSDQDDVWLPGKLDATCEALEKNALVVSDCRVVDTDGGLLHESYFALVNSGSGVLRNLLRNSYLGCCMAFRWELLKLALPIPHDVAHDYWIGMLGELTGRPVFLPRPLVLYRRHGGAASYAAGKSGRPRIARIASRFTLARRLALRMARAGRGG
jgi:glycosyltransferase involved in cell wall biosynthesis